MKKKLLQSKWSKKENDFVISWPDHKANGNFLFTLFNTENLGAFHFNSFIQLFEGTILQELERRGYDLKTLRFSIEKKDPGPSNE